MSEVPLYVHEYVCVCVRACVKKREGVINVCALNAVLPTPNDVNQRKMETGNRPEGGRDLSDEARPDSADGRGAGEVGQEACLAHCLTRVHQPRDLRRFDMKWGYVNIFLALKFTTQHVLY